MKKTQVIKTIVFVVIFILLFIFITYILQAKWITGTSVTVVHDQMYEQEKNTVDVLVLGSSQLVYGVSSMRMLDEYGISAFSCATGEQPVLCGFFYLKEMMKTQDIKTVIYDMSMLFEEEEEARFRKTLDTSPFSLNKLQVILEHCKSEEAESISSYIFPIAKYHSRWNELKRQDYWYKDLNTEVFKGNIMSAEVSQKVSYDKLCVDNDEFEEGVAIDAAQEKYFRQMADYCNEEGIELILIKTPKQSWSRTCMEGIQELADELGLEYIDFNTAEMLAEVDINVKTDFWNGDHLNVRGAEKVTDYLAEYLLSKNSYVDGRENAAYDSKDVEAYQIDRNKKYLQSSYEVEEILELLNTGRYELQIYESADISEYWTRELESQWNELTERVTFLEEKGDTDYGCKGWHMTIYDSKTGDRIDSLTIYADEENEKLSVSRNKD